MATDTRPDFIVFAADYPEPRLLVEVKARDLDDVAFHLAASQLEKRLDSMKSSFGLLFTPSRTGVLRAFSAPWRENRLQILPTDKVLASVGWKPDAGPDRLEEAVTRWLRALKDRDAYQSALGPDPEVNEAFFPELVGSVLGGRLDPEGPE